MNGDGKRLAEKLGSNLKAMPARDDTGDTSPTLGKEAVGGRRAAREPAPPTSQRPAPRRRSMNERRNERIRFSCLCSTPWGRVFRGRARDHDLVGSVAAESCTSDTPLHSTSRAYPFPFSSTCSHHSLLVVARAGLGDDSDGTLLPRGRRERRRLGGKTRAPGTPPRREHTKY